jgi:serine/threonine protein kinase
MIGLILSKKYKIKSLLGAGGMGQVYTAERIEIGDEVAIKALDSNLSKKDLLNEARASSMINHPNICKVYDQFEEGGQCYLVMEKLEGLDLSRAMDLKRHLGDRLTFGFIFGVMREAAEALQYAHGPIKKIFHRDIKPANVFLTNQGEVKLLDFGIAKMIDGENDSKTSNHPFTYAYASPDLWIDGKYDTSNYDESNDLYSLGLIFYELMSLKKAPQDKFFSTEHKIFFQNESEEPIPEGWLRLFEKWIAHKKTDRFKSASELIKAINDVYPHELNAKTEIQKEMSKLDYKSDKNMTLRDNSKSSLSTRGIQGEINSWLIIGGLVASIAATFFLVDFSNKDDSTIVHETVLNEFKQNIQKRAIASTPDNQDSDEVLQTEILPNTPVKKE